MKWVCQTHGVVWDKVFHVGDGRFVCYECEATVSLPSQLARRVVEPGPRKALPVQKAPTQSAESRYPQRTYDEAREVVRRIEEREAALRAKPPRLVKHDPPKRPPGAAPPEKPRPPGTGEARPRRGPEDEA